jgi:hypothetical protein
VGKTLGDFGGAFSVPTARIGFRLGLFDALHRHGAARISELAGRTGLAERYVREWAFAQAANGYIAFDAEQEQFSLTPEQAMVFANKESPGGLHGELQRRRLCTFRLHEQQRTGQDRRAVRFHP